MQMKHNAPKFDAVCLDSNTFHVVDFDVIFGIECFLCF